MSRPFHRTYWFFSTLVALSMLLMPLVPLLEVRAQPRNTVLTEDSLGSADTPPAEPLYRTRVRLRNPRDLARVEELSTRLLDHGDDWALVVVDQQQLQDLARLRFEPRQTDSLEQLGFTLSALSEASMLNAVISAPMSDADGDGLSDTEEGWWCTAPNSANTDGDPGGFTDGEEVFAVLDFTLPRSVRWGYGPPFGPPNAWPDWNGQDGDPGTPACNDGDWDTIPDQAESFMVGTRTPKETTDNDKFDDGQELFGITYCPGAPASCGYGNYPRIEYWNFIKETMLNWVEPPGDNPFVAAFPVPEVSVVLGSWTVDRVTGITTEEGEMTQFSNSYETGVTHGTSTSIADTVTWNNWEETAVSVERPLPPDENSNFTTNTSTDYANFDERRKLSSQSINSPQLYCEPGSLLCRSFGAVQMALADANYSAFYFSCENLAFGCLHKEMMYKEEVYFYEQGVDMAFNVDGYQLETDYYHYDPTSSSEGTFSYRAEQAIINLSQKLDFQAVGASLDGLASRLDAQGALIANALYDVSYQLSLPRLTETKSSGKSWGGAHTTTQTTYEEHTITEGEAFTSGQNWGTAWAVDSSHAADLTFDYIIENVGTEYAREITGLNFNIFLGGDDPELIASYAAWEQFPNGKLENVFPGDSVTFSSNPVPLTLDQMMRIDLGEPLTVVLADFSYGADELFYQDAVGGGITVFIEDGVEDGDELVDSFVIPTWGTESVLDVVVRYFPHEIDPDDNINALWTPEFNGTNPPDWNEHFLSNIAWWNIYQTCEDNDPPIPSDPYDCTNVGSTALHEQDARQGDAVLLRFNRDSDRDGYQDRVEMQYYCALPDSDPDNAYCADAHLRPEIHPQPEVIAAATATRIGDEVTVLLKIANSGNFDIYGVDAVLYAADDTVTVGNNTVGGNGLVHPGQQVAVGSLVLMDEDDLVDWQLSTATPYATGNYVGASDAAYTFTVDIPGVVGSDPAGMTWANSVGITGTLDLGSAYHAPLPVEVADGVMVGFNTGTLVTGESFSLSALTPRDTFSYTIESEPYTDPVIVVSYSDPQGIYKFVTPITVTNLISDITPYAGQMLKDVRLDIITHGPVSASEAQTTTLTLNSAHPEPIVDGHVYLNFVADGELVLELPYTMTIQPGPSVIPISWSTDQFSQTYDSAAENILIAFWTDAQDNIIDSAARPLNTFLNDPPPVAETSSLSWDFGTVIQGQIATTEIAVGNNGLPKIFAAIETSAPGISLMPVSSTRIDPASFQTLKLSLDSAELPVGPYSDSITIRTNDIANPEVVINVTGAVEPIAGDAFAYTGDVYRPWDQTVFISGTFAVNEPVTFTHSISDVPDQMHPLYVYSVNRNTLNGIGEFGYDFDGDTASIGIFGNGGDGDIIVTDTIMVNDVRTSVIGDLITGTTTISVTDAAGFTVGDVILVHQTQGLTPGAYEFHTVTNIDYGINIIEVKDGLENSYNATGSATLYRDTNYSGTSETFTSHEGCLNDNPIGGGTASSIELSPGTSARLFHYCWYGSDNVTVTTSIENLATVGMDNYINSIRVFGGEVQVIRVPQYRNVTIVSGGSLVAPEWNGIDGGIVAFLASGTVTIEGSVLATGAGFRGGKRGYDFGINHNGEPGESFQGRGEGPQELANNGGGGGGGLIEINGFGGGGGGGGYANVGEEGEPQGERGGNPGQPYGQPSLTRILFGSGGGGGGVGDAVPVSNAGRGGYGGGIVSITAAHVVISGTVSADGSDGETAHPDNGGGGGGSGGSIRVTARTVSYENGNVTALAGKGGPGNVSPRGGDGSAGRIGVVFCEAASGTSDPVAFEEQIICYIVRQLESDSSVTELNLPVEIDGHTHYQIQYGQRGEFAVTSPFTGTQFYTDTYSLTLPKRNYTGFTEDALFENLASSTYTYTLDIGADGSTDWTGSGAEQPLIISSPDLSDAFNTFLTGTAEAYGVDVVIPISMTLDTSGDVFLTNIVATAGGDSDPQVGASDLTVSNVSPMETDIVTATATIHNLGVYTATNVVVSLFAGDPFSSSIYLGSDFIPTIAPSGSEQAAIAWNTTGYTGTVVLFAVLDIAGHLEEQDEDNNTTSIIVTVQTRPDLSITAVALDGAARQDLAIDVLVTAENSGQTDATIQTISLYDGDPDTDGLLIGNSDVAVTADLSVTVPISWTPTVLGPTTLYAVADSGDSVPESNEDNNQGTAGVYAGWGAPVPIDAGAAGDIAYDPTTGYGYLTAGTVVTSCGAEPYQTYRERSSGELLQYQFDHLLPDRSYHLDLSFFLCSGSRNLEITVDGSVTTTVTASNNDLERVSILLDPVAYGDNSIVVSIEKISGGLGGPVVSELTLTDIRYCYRDSAPVETAYADTGDGCGWLPGSSGDDSWGNLPYETVRFADSGPVSYQFDGLDPANYYEIDLTFYEDAMDGSGRIQNTVIDGMTVLAGLTLSSTVQYLTVDVPGEAYETDQSIQVDIADVVVSQPVISEIAVEEKTLLPELLADRVQAAVILGGSAVGSRVYVVDDEGEAVAGVDVAIEWTLPDSSTVIDTLPTNSLGRAQFLAPDAGPGTYTITVQSLSKAGYVYLGRGPTEASSTRSSQDLIVTTIQIAVLSGGTSVGTRIFVEDDTGGPVQGALVEVEWTLPDTSIVPASASTNASGRVQILAPDGGPGLYVVTVTNVTKTGYTWTGGDVITKSIVRPNYPVPFVSAEEVWE